MRQFLLFLFILTLFIATDVSLADNTIERIAFGQKNFSAILEISGGLNGKILLADTPGSTHEEKMLFSITQLVPKPKCSDMGGNDTHLKFEKPVVVVTRNR